jgi:hypothetical protein
MLGGSGRVDITPTKPVPLGGYVARTKPSTGVHDPLFARALVLDDGAMRIAVVTCDLLAFEPSAARAIRERVERATGIPAAHTMLTCSHTHSAPSVAPLRMGEPAAGYRELVEDRIVQAVRQAVERLRPVHLGAGRAKVYLGMNRRQRTAEGSMQIGKNPAGYAWPWAPILVVGAEGGGPLAVLFSYGAHPVALGPDNLRVSGDYVGLAEREVEENFGGHVTALFALGFAGNVNVDVEERGLAEAERAGAALGRAVLEAIKAIPLGTGHRLAACSRRVALPLEPPPSPLEAERILLDERGRLARVLGHGENEAEVNTRRVMAEWAADLAALARREVQNPTVDLEVQVLAVGDIALVGLSAEVFAEYAKMLAELSPFPHTFPISVANGALGYLPTAAAFAEGGYEVETAPRYFGVLGLRPEAEGLVRQALAEVLAEAALRLRSGQAVAPASPGTQEGETT